MNENDSKIHDKLMIVVEQTADHIMITDKAGIIEYVNRAFEQTTGYSAKEVVGQSPSILKSGHHGQDYYELLWRTILKGNVFYATTTNKKKNGDVYYADQSISPLMNDSGEITHFVSVWKDITERIHHEEELKQINDQLELEKKKLEELIVLDERINTIEDIDQMINYVLCTICYILESERCSLMLLDEDTKQLAIRGAIGLDNQDIMKQQVKLGEGIAGLVAQKKKPLLVEVVDTDKRIQRENRQGYKTQSFLSVPIHFGDKVLGVVNVTDRVNADSEIYTELDLKVLLSIVRRTAVAINKTHIVEDLKQLTITDSMTGLFNHRYFMSSLEHEIKRAERTNESLCLMMIDVDDFKSYNDKYGHPCGDKLLKGIGGILREHLREIDISCRYAGDEFVVILPETNLIQAEVVAQKILDQICKLRLRRKITCSIGISAYQEKMLAEDLISAADRALYRAKDKGKDGIEISG